MASRTTPGPGSERRCPAGHPFSRANTYVHPLTGVGPAARVTAIVSEGNWLRISQRMNRIYPGPGREYA
jgi:hypothetical protein